MTDEQKKQLAVHLRNVIRYRLMMWDEANAAEVLIGRELPTSGEDLDWFTSGFDKPDELGRISDDDIIKAFQEFR